MNPLDAILVITMLGTYPSGHAIPVKEIPQQNMQVCQAEVIRRIKLHPSGKPFGYKMECRGKKQIEEVDFSI